MRLGGFFRWVYAEAWACDAKEMLLLGRYPGAFQEDAGCERTPCDLIKTARSIHIDLYGSGGGYEDLVERHVWNGLS